MGCLMTMILSFGTILSEVVPPASGGVTRASCQQAPSRYFDLIAYQGVDEKTGQEITMHNSPTNKAYLQPPMNHHIQSYSPPPVNSHMQNYLPEKPKAKQIKAEQQVDFSARIINKTTERLLDPVVAEAAMNVLEALSSSALNVTKIIVNAKTNQGTPAVGESPAVVDSFQAQRRSWTKRRGCHPVEELASSAWPRLSSSA